MGPGSQLRSIEVVRPARPGVGSSGPSPQRCCHGFRYRQDVPACVEPMGQRSLPSPLCSPYVLRRRARPIAATLCSGCCSRAAPLTRCRRARGDGAGTQLRAACLVNFLRRPCRMARRRVPPRRSGTLRPRHPESAHLAPYEGRSVQGRELRVRRIFQFDQPGRHRQANSRVAEAGTRSAVRR